MSVILAIEPDSAQADVLRHSVPERVGGELVLVTTTSAALAEIAKRAPDVLLFGRSITKKDQDAVVAQARTATDGPELLTFVIPELRGAHDADRPKPSSRFGFWKRPAVEADLWDPVLFAEQIATSIGKVEGARRKMNGSKEASATAPVPAPVEVAQWDAPRHWEGEQHPAHEHRESWTFDNGARAPEPEAHETPESGDSRKVILGVVAAHGEDVRAGEILAAELVKIRREAEEKLNFELARVRAEAEQTLEETAALALESDRARQDADARLEQELARLREQTEQLRQETEQARRDGHTVRDAAMMAERVANQEAAAQALDAEVARVRAETEARFEAELARVREHAEQARLAQEQAQRDSESIRDTAARALEAEVARVRAEAEARLDAELVRVREQAEQARLAHEQTKADTDSIRDEAAVAARTAAEQATARALEAEVARVRAEAEARFEAELAQAREQANQMRLAHEQARRDTDTIRDAAAEAARVAAEEAAARALEAEVMRVRAEAESRFENELARLRDQANQAQAAHEQARRETDTIRDAAAHAARTAAEQAAAKALEGEVARVRAETEARFENELARVREQAEQMRLAQEQAWRDSDAAREQAARAARMAAEESATSALQIQLAKVTADTQDRLEQELARVRQEADQAREAQHQAQAEMARLREQAAHEARAAAQAAVAEATRGKNINSAEIPQWERDRRIISDGVATAWYADEQPVEEEKKSWLGLWAVAATVFLVAAVSFALGMPASLMSGSAGWLTGMGFGSAPVATVETTPEPAAAPPAPRRAAAARRPAAAEASLPPPVEIIKESGFLSVFSRLPLEIYADGQRLGSTEDGQLLLPPGQHTLEVMNDQFNFRTKIPVNISLGEVTSHTVTMPLAGLRVVTSPGAEIWVEGAMLGRAPLQDLPVQIGTREVVVKHPELGERRGTIEIKLGQTAELNLTFDGSDRPSAPPTLAPLSAPPAPRPN